MMHALETEHLGKRYGRKWALRDCALDIPTGCITGLVGPNGAGKTTLLHLAMGLLTPTIGMVKVLGHRPGKDAKRLLPQVGFVAQEHPLYRAFRVEEMLTVGQKLNDHWDQSLALRRLHLLDIPLRQRVGQLSGGQQAQLALILTLAKRPALLLLDEPVASLDPLARHEFQHTLMDAVAEDGLSVIISSHIVADMERFCNHLVILSASRAHIADRIDHLLQSHKLLTGPREAAQAETGAYTILASREVEQQCSLLVRTDSAITNPVWQVRDVSLEEIILAYLARPEREKAGAENKKGKVRP